MKRIVTVVGARPQFVKAAVVSRALRTRPDVQEIIVHTGQHYDANMSDVFFEEMEIPEPDYPLGIGSGLHGAQTGLMLQRIEEVLIATSPDWVIVYGDTNSTLAGALAAAKLHMRVAHVEAGLRSFNRRMPEEINRILTDHASDLLFAPTQTALQNLLREGIPAQKICISGDVMYDAVQLYGAKAGRLSQILERLQLRRQSYLLATIHRAENTDDPNRLKAILEGLSAIHEQLPVILPLHPRTKEAVARSGLSEKLNAIRVIEPLSYLDMIQLEKNARLIATDSGGVQKEAFFFEVPCVTLRDETEWVELLALGWNHLVPPTSAESVTSGMNSALQRSPGEAAQPYGNGRSAEVILSHLLTM